MQAKSLMIQGAASNVGKSLITLGVCRALKRRGYNVAPYKSQNMALNSAVTASGGEIGRAQAEQARACGLIPTVEMNPILLKPESMKRSQVVLRGQVVESMDARDYHTYKDTLRHEVRQSLAYMRDRYDLVVIEGAGSPAEINLKAHEIVNMFVAKIFNTPVYIAGDIDRGGVFAALYGTHALLTKEEQGLVKGFIINKFRGDVSLLGDGLSMLEDLSGVKTIGVLPFMPNLRLAEEDSLGLQHRMRTIPLQEGAVSVKIIRLPRISNYEEFDLLEHHKDVHVQYIEKPEDMEDAHLVIIPGTKATRDDLKWLWSTGFADAIKRRASNNLPIMGICGGAQMLGSEVIDQLGVEGEAGVSQGLSLLGYDTNLMHPKVTKRVEVDLNFGPWWVGECGKLSGYEIHMGRFSYHSHHEPSNHVHDLDTDLRENEGLFSGSVWGTHIHGLWENPKFMNSVMELLADRFHLSYSSSVSLPTREQEYDRIADYVEEYLDLDYMIRSAL